MDQEGNRKNKGVIYSHPRQLQQLLNRKRKKQSMIKLGTNNVDKRNVPKEQQTTTLKCLCHLIGRTKAIPEAVDNSISPTKAYKITKIALVESPAANTRGVAKRIGERSPQKHIPIQENPAQPNSPLSQPTSPIANTRGAAKRT